jgi:branched-chain amino acid transport system ATP-binding protein
MPHLSAIENVMLGQHPRAHGVLRQLAPIGWSHNNRWRREALAALERAGLGAFAEETVYNLPYGVQKRIELVRASLAHPRVLLLDEPAAGLNRRETEELATLLDVLSQTGLTMMVVEHDMHFVGRFCQRVIVLNFGRKIAEGSPGQVQRDPAVVEAYLGSDRSLEASNAS